MKKKLIVLICIVAFFIVIFNKKEIKNIKFYQNINDRITLNNLYFTKDKKATYYLINIYDEKNNLIDVKKTNTNMINLNNINSIKEKSFQDTKMQIEQVEKAKNIKITDYSL